MQNSQHLTSASQQAVAGNFQLRWTGCWPHSSTRSCSVSDSVSVRAGVSGSVSVRAGISGSVSVTAATWRAVMEAAERASQDLAPSTRVAMATGSAAPSLAAPLASPSRSSLPSASAAHRLSRRSERLSASAGHCRNSLAEPLDLQRGAYQIDVSPTPRRRLRITREGTSTVAAVPQASRPRTAGTGRHGPGWGLLLSRVSKLGAASFCSRGTF